MVRAASKNTSRFHRRSTCSIARRTRRTSTTLRRLGWRGLDPTLVPEERADWPSRSRLPSRWLTSSRRPKASMEASGRLGVDQVAAYAGVFAATRHALARLSARTRARCPRPQGPSQAHNWVRSGARSALLKSPPCYVASNGWKGVTTLASFAGIKHRTNQRCRCRDRQLIVDGDCLGRGGNVPFELSACFRQRNWLLDSWSYTTPRDDHSPSGGVRRGALRPDHEASFLVLDLRPTQADFGNVEGDTLAP